MTALAGCAAPTSAATVNAAHVTVFAAASLTRPFTTAAGSFDRSARYSVSFSFAGSQQLVQSVIDGAPADVIATADTSTMQRLVNAGLVFAPRIFARNRLEIAVAPGNPKHITSLADLARSDLVTVLAAPAVPAGRYALMALRAAGVAVHAASLELDVEAALEKVESGDADAAIVYQTDVIGAGGRVDGVPIAAQDNVVATYPIAVVRDTANRAAAQAVVTSCLSGVFQRALRASGFLPP